MSPFAWMVGQIQEAIAHQEPMGAVALTPSQRSIVTIARELRRPITAHDIASHAHVSIQVACTRLKHAHTAGIVRVVEQRQHGSTRINVYDLEIKWRE